jgi:hypothetical protein
MVKDMSGILEDIKEVENGNKRMDLAHQKYTGLSKEKASKRGL